MPCNAAGSADQSQMSSFDRLVARSLRQPATPATPCPGPETLAAYLEGALTRDEHGAVERHASICPRCAAHLAALVQLDDQLSAGAPPTAAWWRRPWLVPLAAAVLALVVWTSLPREKVAELSRPQSVGVGRHQRQGGEQGQPRGVIRPPPRPAPSGGAGSRSPARCARGGAPATAEVSRRHRPATQPPGGTRNAAPRRRLPAAPAKDGTGAFSQAASESAERRLAPPVAAGGQLRRDVGQEQKAEAAAAPPPAAAPRRRRSGR